MLIAFSWLFPYEMLMTCSISVCDNCTITLLESSNDLIYYVQTEAREIDLDSVPAPWSRLLSYENASEHLTIKLDDIRKSTEKIENYNDLQIDKVKYMQINPNWKNEAKSVHLFFSSWIRRDQICKRVGKKRWRKQ